MNSNNRGPSAGCPADFNGDGGVNNPDGLINVEGVGILINNTNGATTTIFNGTTATTNSQIYAGGNYAIFARTRADSGDVNRNTVDVYNMGLAQTDNTGADAVDMESHIAARYAEHYGLPFAAVRVISDPAHRALPELTMNAIKPNGNVDMWKVMRGIARNPKTIPQLISTGRDFSRALRSLKGCKAALG